MRLFTCVLVLSFGLVFGCGNEDGEPSAANPASDQSADETGDDVSSGDSDSTPDEVTEPDPGPVIWTGPKQVFEKENFADPLDAANQDAITEGVVLTRGGRDSLYNTVLENRAGSESPLGTRWAEGTTANLEGLNFQPLKTAANDQLKRLPGKSFVLYLVDEDIYLDVTFLTWTSGNSSGGGFSYERSTLSE